MELVTNKTLHFPYSRSAVWAAMGDVGAYQQWWPWLRSFEAIALETGGVWRCKVRPPLPYTVSFAIAFGEVAFEERIVVTVTGDVAGKAYLVLSDAACGGGGHCIVEVRSDLQPQSGLLKVLSTTLPPLARFGHDWILSTGATQFEQRALATNAGAPDTTT